MSLKDAKIVEFGGNKFLYTPYEPSMTLEKVIYGVNYRVKGTPGIKRYFTTRKEAEKFCYNYNCTHPTNRPKIHVLKLDEPFDDPPDTLYIGISLEISWLKDNTYKELFKEGPTCKLRYWVKKSEPRIEKGILIKTKNSSGIGIFGMMKYWSARYELYFDIPHDNSSEMLDFDKYILRMVKNKIRADTYTRKGYPDDVIKVIKQNLI